MSYYTSNFLEIYFISWSSENLILEWCHAHNIIIEYYLIVKYTIATCVLLEPLEKSMTFEDIFSELSRSWNFQKYPRRSRRRGNTV